MAQDVRAFARQTHVRDTCAGARYAPGRAGSVRSHAQRQQTHCIPVGGRTCRTRDGQRKRRASPVRAPKQAADLSKLLLLLLLLAAANAVELSTARQFRHIKWCVCAEWTECAGPHTHPVQPMRPPRCVPHPGVWCRRNAPPWALGPAAACKGC
ncbi:hypothetical protein GY45DRAFT_870996 [Cubamyces sp. BRFM 1775]|nr:hypothetical protein GY45DRAFT_870996 [Cubamyces sp. BRFM 1775]